MNVKKKTLAEQIKQTRLLCIVMSVTLVAMILSMLMDGHDAMSILGFEQAYGTIGLAIDLLIIPGLQIIGLVVFLIEYRRLKARQAATTNSSV